MVVTEGIAVSVVAAAEEGAGNSGGAAHPAKWKLWVLTMIGLYPLLTVLVTVTAPLLDSLAAPLRLACILPVAVGAMVWVIMPLLTRRFAGWLAR